MTVIIDANRTVVVINPPLDNAGQPILPSGAGFQAATITDVEAAKLSTAGSSFSLASDGTVVVTNVAPPTVTTVRAGAGTGSTPPAPTLLSADPNISPDARGVVEIGTGSAPAADVGGSDLGHYELLTITFGLAWPEAPTGVMVLPQNAATAALLKNGGAFYGSKYTTTGFSIYSTVAPGASQPAGTYKVSYVLG